MSNNVPEIIAQTFRYCDMVIHGAEQISHIAGHERSQIHATIEATKAMIKKVMEEEANYRASPRGEQEFQKIHQELQSMLAAQERTQYLQKLTNALGKLEEKEVRDNDDQIAQLDKLIKLLDSKEVKKHPEEALAEIHGKVKNVVGAERHIQQEFGRIGEHLMELQRLSNEVAQLLAKSDQIIQQVEIQHQQNNAGALPSPEMFREVEEIIQEMRQREAQIQQKIDVLSTFNRDLAEQEKHVFENLNRAEQALMAKQLERVKEYYIQILANKKDELKLFKELKKATKALEKELLQEHREQKWFKRINEKLAKEENKLRAQVAYRGGPAP